MVRTKLRERIRKEMVVNSDYQLAQEILGELPFEMQTQVNFKKILQKIKLYKRRGSGE